MADIVIGQMAVPVIEPGEQRARFIGTAFPVGFERDASWFLTARHVAEAANDLALARIPTTVPDAVGVRERVAYHRVETIVKNPKFDMALLRVPVLWEGAHTLPFGSRHQMASQMLNVEFSQTGLLPDGATLHVSPSHHLGHVVQRLWLDERATGERMRALLCSWPAFIGASGSPVIDIGVGGQEPGLVCGMVIENRGTELLPALYEEIRDDQGEIRERYAYYSPNAVAISHEHLEPFVRGTLPPDAQGVGGVV